MQSLSSYKSTTKKAFLLVGPPGSGKTAFGANFKKVHILELDNNLRGPLDYLARNKINVDGSFDIPHILPDGKLVPRLERWLRLLQLVSDAINNPEVDAIFIDGLTELTNYAQDEVRRQQGLKIADPNNRDPKVKGGDDPLRIQDWGGFAQLLKHFMVMVKSSGKTLIVSAHTTSDKDEMTGTLRWFLMCPGQTREVLAGYFDEVYLFSKVEKDGKAQVFMSTIPESKAFSQLGLKTSGDITNNTLVDFSKLQHIFTGV